MPPPSAFLAPLVAAGSNSVSSVAILLPDEVTRYCRAASIKTLIGTVNGMPLRRAVRALGDGRTGLSVGKGFLADIGAAVGELVEVELDYAADPDVVVVPPALEAAFGVRPEARAAYAALPVFDRRGLCMRIERGKTDTVRIRRAEQAVDKLLV